MKRIPKNGEFWVVEDEDRGERLVVEAIEWGDRPCWYRPGDEEACPYEWFRPVRKVILGRAATAKKMGATLSASAQNERGNRPTVDDSSLQAGSETEAPSGKRL